MSLICIHSQRDSKKKKKKKRKRKRKEKKKSKKTLHLLDPKQSTQTPSLNHLFLVPGRGFTSSGATGCNMTLLANCGVLAE